MYKYAMLAASMLTLEANAQFMYVLVENETNVGGQHSSICDGGCDCPTMLSWHNGLSVREIIQPYDPETCEYIGGYYTHFIVDNGKPLIIQGEAGIIDNIIRGKSELINPTPGTPLMFSTTSGMQINDECVQFDTITYYPIGEGFLLLFKQWADMDYDGQITVMDIFTYLSRWFMGSPEADMNGDGDVTTDDIFTYLNRWFNS